jgi:hypothetical protein
LHRPLEQIADAFLQDAVRRTPNRVLTPAAACRGILRPARPIAARTLEPLERNVFSSREIEISRIATLFCWTRGDADQINIWPL